MTFAEMRRLCMSLPEVEERETWGEATFRVHARIFVMGSPDGGFVSVKATLDDQSGLVEMDPETFSASAYTGRFGWVRVRLRTVGKDVARRLVTAAWKRTAPRRLVAQLEASEREASSAPRAGPGRSRASSTGTAGSPRPRTRPPSQ